MPEFKKIKQIFHFKVSYFKHGVKCQKNFCFNFLKADFKILKRALWSQKSARTLSNLFSHWTAVIRSNFQQKSTYRDLQTIKGGAKLRFLSNTGWLPRHIYRWILNQGSASVRAWPGFLIQKIFTLKTFNLKNYQP